MKDTTSPMRDKSPPKKQVQSEGQKEEQKEAQKGMQKEAQSEETDENIALYWDKFLEHERERQKNNLSNLQNMLNELQLDKKGINPLSDDFLPQNIPPELKKNWKPNSKQAS